MDDHCYCCNFKDAQWSFRYEKMLCRTCVEILDRLNTHRIKLARIRAIELSEFLDKHLPKAHYNKSLELTEEGHAASDRPE